MKKLTHQYRELNKKALQKECLLKTAGIWKTKKVDGLKYVEPLRDEWEKSK